MTTRVLLEPVYILHSRPYQNSSLLVDFFSEHYGRVTALARSARGPRSRFRGHLQLFSPLLASWSGRCELMNLNQLELSGPSLSLSGQPLLCAFYLNELLVRLLANDDPHPEIFADYQRTLYGLQPSAHLNLSVVLRRFEKRLLDHLGYGLDFQVNSHDYYQWVPEQGFLRCEQVDKMDSLVFSGRSLLALHAEEWNNPEDLAAAKQLMRLALGRHLGSKPLKSRELLR